MLYIQTYAMGRGPDVRRLRRNKVTVDEMHLYYYQIRITLSL